MDMEITLEYVTNKFREYNKQIFNGELPLPQFRLLKSYRYSGKFSCKKPIGKRMLKGQRIEISCYYDWKEEDFKNVMLHEMLHYYLAFRHIDNNISHGEEFLYYADKLNQQYGCNITVFINTSNFIRAKNAPKLSWVLMHIFG